jgi:hypothetical protein
MGGRDEFEEVQQGELGERGKSENEKRELG